MPALTRAESKARESGTISYSRTRESVPDPTTHLLCMIVFAAKRVLLAYEKGTRVDLQWLTTIR
jgi:hypothetical protein